MRSKKKLTLNYGEKWLKVRVPDYPKALYIELTNRCNLKCKMCRSEGTAGHDMGRELFLYIVNTLFPHAAFVDFRGCGESTILPDLIDLVDVEEFCCKICAGKGTQRKDDFVIVARTEALIVGMGLKEPEESWWDFEAARAFFWPREGLLSIQGKVGQS